MGTGRGISEIADGQGAADSVGTQNVRGHGCTPDERRLPCAGLARHAHRVATRTRSRAAPARLSSPPLAGSGWGVATCRFSSREGRVRTVRRPLARTGPGGR
ncbi:Hypothetical protein CAP_7860 [Chondromyces apiculatus DSM 436]|uniref:Uncharacterized protein n=1 Tax=Chondromyces apiculatus DSM 436 TaxID=1192034 RepID=A0A017SYM4_9BACT|nr:Hypothetical protein CAP_7860 [Chondromyces apiculatus DSM 436]